MAKRHFDAGPFVEPLSKKATFRLAGADLSTLVVDTALGAEVLQQIGTTLQMGMIFTDVNTLAFALTDVETRLLFEINQGCHLPTAEAIDLANSPISDAFVDVLSSVAPALKKINLSFTSVSDSSLMLLAIRCPNLVDINLACCRNVTTQGVEFLFRARNRQIRSINLSQCSGIDSRAVLSIITFCPTIQSLSLGQLQISPVVLARLANRCSNLLRLDLSHVEIPEGLLMQLCQSVKRLDYLDVSFCKNVSPSGINALIRQFPMIEIRAFGVDLAGVEQGDFSVLVF